MEQKILVEQHSPFQSILLHLVPGLLTGIVYYIFIPILHRGGYPSFMAFMVALILVVLPVEMGYLLYQAKKKNGRYSLQGVVLYRSRIPIWQYFLLVPLLLALVGLIFTLMKPVDSFIQHSFFSWVPAFESGLQAGYSQQALILTYGLVALVGAVATPIVEEFYFRGYLLPRMEYAGKWAPLLHTLLFGLYHVWTPWMFLTRTVGILPLAYAVKLRTLNLSIIVHILVNLLDVVTAVIFITGMSSHA
jgi:membrane protease YdiL (CAAX protease family)